MHRFCEGSAQKSVKNGEILTGCLRCTEKDSDVLWETLPNQFLLLGNGPSKLNFNNAFNWGLLSSFAVIVTKGCSPLFRFWYSPDASIWLSFCVERQIMRARSHLDEAFAFARVPSYLVVIKSQAGIRFQRLQSSGEQGGGNNTTRLEASLSHFFFDLEDKLKAITRGPCGKRLPCSHFSGNK